MKRTLVLPASDIRGLGRLAVAATLGATDIVEEMHRAIQRGAAGPGGRAEPRTCGITGFVYRRVRGVTRLTGRALDATFDALAPLFAEPASTPGREAVLAALNGVLGDMLAATGNPLAIPMRFRRDQNGAPTGKLLVLVHGLCMSDRGWTRNGHDHGAALARDLGYTPVYLHYNSGRHVGVNGREFSAALEALVEEGPVPVGALVIFAHSMGGLVARIAVHQGSAAGLAWPRRLRKLVFLGTPHHGTTLERGGKRAESLLEATPYTAPFARLARLRSAGITDLRHGLEPALPLPTGASCYAIAATTGETEGDLCDRLLGDGLVPVESALGRHADPARALSIPEDRRRVFTRTGHLDLLDRSEVYDQILRWLS